MRRRILALVVGMTTLVVLAFAIPLVVFIRNNAYDNGTAALRRDVSDVVGYLRGANSQKTVAQIKAKLASLPTDIAASVELDGTVYGSLPPGGLDTLPSVGQQRGGGQFGSPPTGTSAPTSRPSGAPRGGGGFGEDTLAQSYRDGQLIQLYAPVPNRTDDLYTVRLWASDGTLRAGQTESLLLLVGVAVVLLVVGVVAGEVLTRRIVRPLVDTAGTAQRLSTGDTTARAPTSGPPEVAAVGLALNRLADRIDELIAEERETVADLSHRLRTPLTALRLDAEALRDAGDAERIGTHVGTLERMLTAVIRAARRPQREGRMPSCDATSVVGERVEFWSALTEDQQRVATVELPTEPITVRAGAEDLAAAVDALLENVVAHTPEGVAYAVTLTATEAGARLTVADDGPGLPPDASVRGRSDRGSSGLGLDIARRCAEGSGGAMTMGSSPAGGALVFLDLGRA